MTRAPDSEGAVREVASEHLITLRTHMNLGTLSRHPNLEKAVAAIIAAHEPAPVDPLYKVGDDLFCHMALANGMERAEFAAYLANRLRARLPQAALDALGEG